MLCDIRHDADKTIFQRQLQQVQIAIANQNSLHSNSRINGPILDKLLKLREYLELQLRIYKEISRL